MTLVSWTWYLRLSWYLRLFRYLRLSWYLRLSRYLRLSWYLRLTLYLYFDDNDVCVCHIIMQGIQCATQARIYIGITYTLRGERDPIISFILHFHIVNLSSNLNLSVILILKQKKGWLSLIRGKREIQDWVFSVKVQKDLKL